jgi:hypothetical protein
LALHEQALVGAQIRGSLVLGSFDGTGSYASAANGTSNIELEQDLFGALRLLGNGQVAVLLPFLEARRADRSGSELGGGIGDTALNARYDFFPAGRARYIPGIALMAGMTLPTGIAPEHGRRLGTNATGLGVFQGSLGLALEQTFGQFLVDLIGLVAARTPRRVPEIGKTALAPQWSVILGLAYAFSQGASLSLAAEYSAEGEATIDGMSQPRSSRRRTLLTLAGLWPLSDDWHVRGYVIWDPPIDALGKNQLQNTGLGVTLIHAWL